MIHHLHLGHLCAIFIGDNNNNQLQRLKHHETLTDRKEDTNRDSDHKMECDSYVSDSVGSDTDTEQESESSYCPSTDDDSEMGKLIISFVLCITIRVCHERCL